MTNNCEKVKVYKYKSYKLKTGLMPKNEKVYYMPKECTKIMKHKQPFCLKCKGICKDFKEVMEGKPKDYKEAMELMECIDAQRHLKKCKECREI